MRKGLFPLFHHDIDAYTMYLLEETVYFLFIALRLMQDP